MWNELFISYNGQSLFLELLSNYTRGAERSIIRILKIKETTFKNLFNHSHNPFLVTTLGEKITQIEKIAEFITTLTGTHDILFGRTEKDVINHFTFIKDFDLSSDKLGFLDATLRYNSFCNGYSITISDLFAYSIIITDILHLNDVEKVKHSNVFRWVFHLQSLSGLKEQIGRLKFYVYPPNEKLFLDLSFKKKQKDVKDDANPTATAITANPVPAKETTIDQAQIELNKAAAALRKAAKKEEKTQKSESQAETKTQDTINPDLIKDQNLSTSITTSTANPSQSSKKQKPTTTEKKEDNTSPISKLDIRVGRIISIVENTQSDKLYNEEIDIGGGEIRKIASGLKNKIPLESLKGQLVVVLCNLKPRELCGWMSHGMLLCANDSSGKIDFLRPPANSEPGDRVIIGEYELKPETELHNKKEKNAWFMTCEKMRINGDGVAVYEDSSNWATTKGVVSCSLKNSSIS